MKVSGVKKSGWVVIGLIVLAVGYFLTNKFLNGPKDVGQSAVVGSLAIPDAPEASMTGQAKKYPFPGTAVNNGSKKMTLNEMAWNSQSSINYANGGPKTTKSSLLALADIDMTIVRQDDGVQSATDMVKYIQDYKNGARKDGFFYIVMGTYGPATLQSIIKNTKDLGPEYQPVIFASTGGSYGEDQVMGPLEIKNNKQLLRGKVIRGVRLDGDLDLAIKLAGDNGIPVNVNDKLYDRNALNFSYSSTYLSAVNDYNNGLTEKRKIVVNGRTTGKDTTVGMDLVTTWTPGDVNVVNGKGAVTIVSTRDYASIMPNVVIGCKKYLNDNRSAVEAMIAAWWQASDQIRNFEDVKAYAMKLNAQIWNEQDQTYWLKYFNGVKHDENTFLGGSRVYNAADANKLFGLQGTVDVYKQIYTTFGNKQKELYPDDLPEYPDYNKAVDKSFMMSVIANNPDLLEGKALTQTYSNSITSTVSSKDVHINFSLGSDDIDPSSEETLQEILSSAVTAEGLKIGVYGHTDQSGDPIANQELSERRAQSVKQWLIRKGVPANRIESKGFGEEQPIPGGTAAQNRRVQIKMGN